MVNHSYVNSPAFLSGTLHLMACFEIPMHLIGAYCIIFKTPRTMRSVKWTMFNLHFWSVFLDLTISLFTTPYVLFPALIGRSLGIFEYVGVPVELQLYLIVTLFPAVGVSITAILENRFYLLFSWESSWKYFRIPFLTFLYLSSFLCFLPSYLSIPEQKQAMAEVLKIIPEIQEYILSDGKMFVLSTDFHEFFWTLVIMIGLVTGTSVTFARILYRNMKERSRLLNMSPQMTSMPILILILPISYLAISMFSGYFNQAANNLCFIITAFHGLLSTAIMITVHKPYRDFIYIVFFQKIHRLLLHTESKIAYSMSMISRTSSGL
ncbi:Protein CBR-SRH-269 [Caenorhabditis briggsae]|uniref:Protein CBR-SRH-269 n=1 Tax=Caenorhabditis briggsae TaxID=6238 RepID=A8Y2N0_CAEBR|nr:Protein CBR-SRH-269 [Caenorhabditis briggsae]CAP39155.2 Protein CBR-SRH-269 [Caenorhabditis briggsae]